MKTRGFGSLRVEGDKTFIRYYLHGKQRAAVLKTRDPKAPDGSGERPAVTEKEVADARLRFIKELAAGKRRPTEMTRLTVNELLDRLIRWSKNQGIGEYMDKGRKIEPDPKWPADRPHGSASLDSHLKPIRLAFGDRKALSITTDDVEVYKTKMLDDGYENASINRGLEKLTRAFTWAAGLKGENKPPLIDPRDILRITALDESGNVRQTYLDRAQFETLMTNIPEPAVQHFCTWCIQAGMRRGEAENLAWTMFDKRTWSLTIPGRATKNGQGRVLALDGELRPIIEARLKLRRDLEGCPWIFHRDGKKMGDFRKMWRTAVGKVPGLIKTVPKEVVCSCSKSGKDHKHVPVVHDLRRSAAILLEESMGLPLAMSVMAQKTISMHLRYNIGDLARQRKGLAKAAAHWKNQPDKLEPAGEVTKGEFAAQKAGRK